MVIPGSVEEFIFQQSTCQKALLWSYTFHPRHIESGLHSTPPRQRKPLGGCSSAADRRTRTKERPWQLRRSLDPEKKTPQKPLHRSERMVSNLVLQDLAPSHSTTENSLSERPSSRGPRAPRSARCHRSHASEQRPRVAWRPP